MLRWRLLLGALLIAALIAICWLDTWAAPTLLNTPLPGLWLMPLALMACVLATSEMLVLARAAGIEPQPWPIYVGNILIVSGNWLAMLIMQLLGRPAHLSSSSWPAVDSRQVMSPSWLLAAAAILVFFVEMRRYEKPGRSFVNVAASVLALVYVGLLLNFAVSLRIGWGIGAIATWVIVVKAGDTGAYFTGRLLGRHKMCPTLSPGKTIEGAVGALVWSCLGSWLAFHYLIPAIGEARLVTVRGPWWGWIAFGLLVGVTGMIGDLAESLLKRDVGRKDSSDWLPGFGGVLDILDSLLLAAPVAWFCWVYGLIGPIPLPMGQ